MFHSFPASTYQPLMAKGGLLLFPSMKTEAQQRAQVWGEFSCFPLKLFPLVS